MCVCVHALSCVHVYVYNQATLLCPSYWQAHRMHACVLHFERPSLCVTLHVPAMDPMTAPSMLHM